LDVALRAPLDAKEQIAEPADYDAHVALNDITLDHDWILFSVALLHRGDPPERLLGVADDAESWQVVCRMIAAMERSGLRSLEKPIEIGDGGPNSWVIA
jgi:hypothetical protein